MTALDEPVCRPDRGMCGARMFVPGCGERRRRRSRAHECRRGEHGCGFSSACQSDIASHLSSSPSTAVDARSVNPSTTPISSEVDRPPQWAGSRRHGPVRKKQDLYLSQHLVIFSATDGRYIRGPSQLLAEPIRALASLSHARVRCGRRCATRGRSRRGARSQQDRPRCACTDVRRARGRSQLSAGPSRAHAVGGQRPRQRPRVVRS